MKLSRQLMRLGGFVAGLAGNAGAVLAQPAPAMLAECHAIAEDAARLACYDAVSRRNPDARAGSTPAPAIAAPALPDPAAAAGGAGGTHNAAASMIDEAWAFSPSSRRYDIRFHNENYLLFGRYTSDVNAAPFAAVGEALGVPPDDINSTEAKFQFSFKARLWATDDRRWGVWAAYTQQNWWQVYNGDLSRPFRETNYMPELFASYRPDVDLPGGFRWGLLNAGYTHQSNGRTDILSRSWDRLFAEFGVENGNLGVFAKVWYRIPESDEEDDNPDITDYLGHGAISALYRWRGHSFSGWLRGNVGTGKGAVQLAWTSPPILGPLRGYVQFFSGYGESLIDYNWRQTTIGAGLALSDGL